MHDDIVSKLKVINNKQRNCCKNERVVSEVKRMVRMPEEESKKEKRLQQRGRRAARRNGIRGKHKRYHQTKRFKVLRQKRSYR